MAEGQTPKFDIPWATLLPVIAALAGIVAQYRPLVSTRPGIPSEKPIEVAAAQDVDARLWQDPLAVAQKAKAQLDADLLAKPVPKTRVLRHQLNALVSKVRDSAAESAGRVLLLAVMLDSGPYIEQGESRLRARQAVLAGLNESGYVPKDSEHIGFITISEPVPIWEDTPTGKTAEDGFVLIPWEECKPNEESVRVPVYPPKTTDAFILWLPAVSFSPRPLASLADLFEPFVKEIHDRVDVKLIGPANSTGLQQMIAEAKGWKSSSSSPEEKTARNDALDGAWIISPRATAPASALMAGSATEDQLQQAIESCVDPPEHGGLHFLRTIATDDLVLRNLITELKLRDVHVAPRKKEEPRIVKIWARHGAPRKKKPWISGDHVIILTEWDNPYGRSLADTFEKEALLKKKHITEDNRDVTHGIRSIRYMHGIDGRLPGDPAKGNTPADSQKTQQTQEPAALEATEGLDQSDFLRRLARQLKDEDTSWRREGEGGIRAIGLLGSDIYDKLMILRALRPEFRDAVFFTNNYDAHFERRDDWGDVHNLVVASPFGSTFPPNKEWLPSWSSLPPATRGFEPHVAPFRDNIQTSMFVGTLAATGRLEPVALFTELSHGVRIFEIGRRGAQELQQEQLVGGGDFSGMKSSRWFRDWLRSDGVWWHLILAAVALLLIVGWIGLSLVDQRLPGGGSSGERLKRVCSSTAFWLICGVPMTVIGVAWLSQQGTAAYEPLAFFSGISIWPSEMLRLIALLLAVHFMIHASVDLRANEREVTRRFFPELRPSEKWHWRNPRLGLRRWQKEHPDWGSDIPFSAKDAWSAYLVRNQFWPRFIRIGTLFVIYFCFSVAVSTLFPQPVTPARGPIAFKADTAVLITAVIAMMILTFYVVDAIRLNSNFIRIFTYGVTKWEPDISLGKDWIPPLTEEDLSRYRDIFFVAQRTEVVAPLIWYPLIVLTVMFVARSSFFDNWTWPLSLILIFTLNSMWAIGSAVFLRRAAEHLRESAISKLQLLRVKSFLIAGRGQIFDELIAEIRGLNKGAFAPLTEQPFIRAIVYPSGGLGLLAVGQRLLDIF